jgi:hypothetical protein
LRSTVCFKEDYVDLVVALCQAKGSTMVLCHRRGILFSLWLLYSPIDWVPHVGHCWKNMF